MKKVFIMILIWLLSNNALAQIPSLSPDQNDIFNLIQKLYRVHPETFNDGYFDGKVNQDGHLVDAKRNVSRHCQLLAEFLVKEAVIKGKEGTCITGGMITDLRYITDFRYGEVFSFAEDGGMGWIPTPQIHIPEVQGNKATVYVALKLSQQQSTYNNTYYLKKTATGWRINRVEWRNNDNWLHNKVDIEDRFYVFPPEQIKVKLTSDHIAIKKLIQEMYAIDMEIFENETFGSKFNKYGELIVDGKRDIYRHCKLVEKFIVKEAFAKNKDCSVEFRYPDGSAYGEGARETPLPKPIINTPTVLADKAKILVQFKAIGASSLYFLKKKPEGWRIYKVLSQDNYAERTPNIVTFPAENRIAK